MSYKVAKPNNTVIDVLPHGISVSQKRIGRTAVDQFIPTGSITFVQTNKNKLTVTLNNGQAMEYMLAGFKGARDTGLLAAEINGLLA